MKRALIISLQEFAPFLGGMARYSEGICLALKDTYQVEVFTTEKSLSDKQPYQVHRLFLERRLKQGRIAGVIQLGLWMIQKKPEIVITTDALSLKIITTLRFLLPPKTFAVVHGTDILDTAMQTGVVSLQDWKILLPYLRGVFANSGYTLELFQSHISTQAPIKVLYPPLLTKKITKKPHIQPTTPQIVTVGRLTQRKGFEWLLQTLASAPDLPPFHLTIIGKGPLEAPLRKQIETLQLQEKVSLLTDISHEEREQRLARATLALQPSTQIDSPGQRVEGFGMSVIEAQSYGVPVLASDHGGLPEAVGTAGLIYEDKNKQEFLNTFRRLLSDESLRRQLIKQIPKHLKTFSFDTFQTKLSSFVDQPQILFATEWFRPLIGGAGEQALKQAKFLSRDYQISILTKRLEKEHFPCEKIEGIRVKRVGMAKKGRISDYRLIFATLSSVWKQQPDILHIHGSLTNNFAIGCFLGAKLRKIPIVSKVAVAGELRYGNEMRKVSLKQRLNILNYIRQFLALQADAFIAISKDIQRELQELHVQSEKIHFIPNGVDTSVFHPVSEAEKNVLRKKLGLSEKKVIFLSVSRFVQRKGLLELVDYWKLNAPANAFLLIIGSGFNQFDSIEESLKNKAENVSSIKILKPTLEIASYFQLSDVSLSLSESEGLSNSFLEALACGLPIIAKNISGFSDVLRNNIAGIFVSSHQDLKKAIDYYLLPAHRAKASEAALETSTSYNFQKTVQNLHHLYQSFNKRQH